MLRYYDCTSGTISITGTDIKEAHIERWRARCAAVFQDFGKYAFMLKDNIKIAHLTSDDADTFEHAIKLSGVGEFAQHLPDGMETQVGKEFSGTEFSGGQWQKIAIARAIYRNADLLILDEPTSALDPRSEYRLFQTFSEIAQGKTTLLITHRLGSVQMADHVLVMKEGRVVEWGSHSDLLAREGEYANLWNLQTDMYGPSQPQDMATA